MNQITYTLLTDGSSDQSLIPIITWTLREFLPSFAVQEQWADLRGVKLPDRKLESRIPKTLEYYPCDILFVHRDAENQSHQNRLREIMNAVERCSLSIPTVCIIPTRMQEAWLFSDEMAIRTAAGNPHGKMNLAIPSIKDCENIPDPKEVLYSLLREACGKSGRRLKSFPVTERVLRVAMLTNDFSPLRYLTAFKAFENELSTVLSQIGYL